MPGLFNFIKKSTAGATPSAVIPPVSQPATPSVQPPAGTNGTSSQASEINKMLQEDISQLVKPSQQSPAPMSPSLSSPKSSSPTAPQNPLSNNLTGNKRENIDVMTHLTQRSNRAFLAANTKAKELKSTYVDSEHLLHGLLTDGEIYKMLVDMKVQPQLIDEELNKIYKHENNAGAPQTSPRVKKIIDDSLIVARKLGFEFISPEHLLIALFEEGEGVGARTLVKLGLKKEDLNKKVVGKKEGLEADQKEAEKKMNVLEQFTVDLTAKAAQGLLDPVVERSEVIERAIHILSRRTKNNPALVGEAGVGKTAIVEGLAQRIVTKQVPEPLLNKRILELDLMSILAGASHRGEFEERMKNLIEEVKKTQGQTILFIDEIHNIVGAGSSGEGSLDASNFLKPALARGEIQIIGATTLTEYRKYVEKDPALERRFQPVLVPEPTEEQAVKMLKTIKDKYEAFHKVKIPDDAVDAAVRYSKRYIGDRFLPDKAVDLIDEAASAVRLPLISLPEEIKSAEDRIAQLNQEIKESEKAGDKVKARVVRSKVDDLMSALKEKQEQFATKKAQTTTVVTESIIKDIVARWTGIPVSKITGSEKEKLAKLEDIMHKRLIDQETAVGAVAAAVRRGRAGLKSNQRPIGSFVFLGPTGVGKTELAKTLADILFGQEEAMLRFDMTEYMEKHEVAKLLGAPPGYVGYEEGGKLTEAVRRRPYSVVLFDEVEKAHPDIFNILLQILDDGRLTDNKGHTVSFKNTVIICTSNIGTEIIQDELLKNKEDKINETLVQYDKKKYEEIKVKVMEELRKFFRPELINRFDEVIVFEPLQFVHMIEIVRLQLKSLGKLLEDQDMGFSFTDNAVKEVVRNGFDPIYGARPLKRAIQKLLENPISTLIIESKVQPGNTVHVDFDGESFVFNVEQVVFDPVNQKSVSKNLVCAKCSTKFSTEVSQSATPVCVNCGSKEVHEVEEEKPQTEPIKDPQSAIPPSASMSQSLDNQPAQAVA